LNRDKLKNVVLAPYFAVSTRSALQALVLELPTVFVDFMRRLRTSLRSGT